MTSRQKVKKNEENVAWNERVYVRVHESEKKGEKKRERKQVRSTMRARE